MKKFSTDTSRHLVRNDADYAAMVLDKAIQDFRLDRILNEIDQSLESRNKEEFLRLTEELKMIRKRSFIQ